MGRRLKQNDTNTSVIYILYIGHPIYISDVQYIHRTSDIYIRRLVSISDVRYRYRTSDIQYPTSARARARAGILDVGYTRRYWTSDIDIRHWI